MNSPALSPADLAMVLLVRDADEQRAMPTTRLQDVASAVQALTGLGVPAVKIFAGGDRRDATGSAGAASDCVMRRAIEAAKAAAE